MSESVRIALLLSLLVIPGIPIWRNWVRPAIIHARYQRLLSASPRFDVARKSFFFDENFLGLGREGIVFAIPKPGNESPDLPLAVKILFPDRKHDAEKTLARQRRKIAMLRALDPRSIPCMMAVIEAGIIGEGNEQRVYQLIEAVDGENATRAIRRGAFGAGAPERRLRALVELLDTCLALAKGDLHAVHADTDNLMLDAKGRLRIIDLDAVYLGPISETDRLRQLKRLSRSILAIMGDAWSQADFGTRANEAKAFRARLAAHARSEKRSPPPKELAFASLAEMRDELAGLSDALKG